MTQTSAALSRMETWVFVIAALTVGPISVYASNLIPAVGAVAALTIVGHRAFSRSWPPVALGRLPWLLALIVAWAASSAAWAEIPADSLEASVKMAALAVAAYVLLSAALGLPLGAAKRIGAGLVAGVAITLVFIAIEMRTHSSIWALFHGRELAHFHWRNLFNRPMSLMVLLVWPASFLIWRRFGWPAAVVTFAAVIAVAAQTTSAATLVALGAGTMTGIAAFAAPRLTRRALQGLLILVFIVTPLLPLMAPLVKDRMLQSGVTNGSAVHRLVIWDYVAGKALERPLIGWGMNGARNLPGAEQDVDIGTAINGVTIRGSLVSLHPHNGLLQVWLELGLPGILAVFALLFLLLRWIGRNFEGRDKQAVALAVFAAGLVILELSYGIWQGWWQSSLWITAALTLAALGPRPATTP